MFYNTDGKFITRTSVRGLQYFCTIFFNRNILEDIDGHKLMTEESYTRYHAIVQNQELLDNNMNSSNKQAHLTERRHLI